MNKPCHTITFADLLQLIDADLALHPQKAANLKSSINRFLRVVSWTNTMEASFPRVRRALKDALPANQEVKTRTWQNTKSDLRFTLERYGAPARAPLRKDLDPNWAELRDMVDDEPKFARGLSNFIHFCSAQGISCEDIDDNVMTRYHTDLKERSLKNNPDRLYRRVCKLWNEVLDTYGEQSSSHKVTVPCFRDTISFPLDAFPASFRDDLKRYEDYMSGSNLFDDNALNRGLKESTIRSHVFGFRRLASLIVKSGTPITEVTSLLCLVEQSKLRAGLELYQKRLGKVDASNLGNLIGALITLSRKYLRLDEIDVRWLVDLSNRLPKRRRGMTTKNIDRLHQFETIENLRAFLDVTDRLIREANKIKSPPKRAVRIQTALLHELLLVAPIRAANLTRLRVDEHLHCVGKGNKKRMFLQLMPDQTKNGKEMEFALPIHFMRLYDQYISDHRPQLLNAPDEGWLLPGRNGSHKNQVTVSDQMVKAVERLTGLRINLHLYRHIAGFMYLRSNPGQYETIRLLLGHASVDTTITFYAGFNDTQTRSLYGDLIAELRLADREHNK